MLTLYPINALEVTGTWLAIWGIYFLPKPIMIARQAGWRVNWRRWGAFAAVVVPLIFVINCLWILTGWGVLVDAAYNVYALLLLWCISPQDAFTLTAPQEAWGDALLRLGRIARTRGQRHVIIQIQTATRTTGVRTAGTCDGVSGLGALMILQWGVRHGSTPEDATV